MFCNFLNSLLSKGKVGFIYLQNVGDRPCNMGEHRVGISNKLEHPVLAVLAPFFGHFPLLLKKFLRHRFPKKNWPSNVLGRKLFLFFFHAFKHENVLDFKKVKVRCQGKGICGFKNYNFDPFSLHFLKVKHRL